jgi:hypothetical protein
MERRLDGAREVKKSKKESKSMGSLRLPESHKAGKERLTEISIPSSPSGSSSQRLPA